MANGVKVFPMDTGKRSCPTEIPTSASSSTPSAMDSVSSPGKTAARTKEAGQVDYLMVKESRSHLVVLPS